MTGYRLSRLRLTYELGYYLLAGAGGEGPATLMDEARRGEEMGFGTAFISERWNVKEASSLVGAALRGHQSHADRHRRNQSQHPPSADHRVLGDHDAPVVPRAVHAGHRPWCRRDVRGVRGAVGDDRADGGLRPGDAQALERRGRSSTTTGRWASTRCCSWTRTSRRTSGWPWSRSGRRRWHWAAGRSTTSSCTPTSRPKRCSAAVKTVKDAAEQAGRDPGERAGVVVLRHRRRPSTRGTSAEEDRCPAGDLPSGLRRSDGLRRTTGIPQCCSASGRIRW